jgi:hypothetical protein
VRKWNSACSEENWRYLARSQHLLKKEPSMTWKQVFKEHIVKNFSRRSKFVRSKNPCINVSFSIPSLSQVQFVMIMLFMKGFIGVYQAY